jgi:uncharacterized SAM-binding protein YcdF (DUF218 family)
MIFFFSKLLPMLIYPVGITSLLLLAAAVLTYKRPAAARRCCVVAFTILFLTSNRWVNFALVTPLEDWYLPSASVPLADAIVILGGAVAPAYPPRLNAHLTVGDRLLYAAMLYRSYAAKFVIVSGGMVPWQKSQPEGESMIRVLELMGVPQSAILSESPAANTYEEATSVDKLMETHNLHRILLVTSAMHMPRALQTFRDQGIDAVPSPTDFTITGHDIAQARGSFQEFVLSLMPDADMLVTTTHALKEYLGLAYYRIRH